MNPRNWSDAPFSVLGLKLAEEAGEVCKEMADAWKDGKSFEGEKKELLREISHVEMVCAVLRKRIEFDD